MVNLLIFVRKCHGFLTFPSTMFEIVHILEEKMYKCTLRSCNAYICNTSAHARYINVLSYFNPSI